MERDDLRELGVVKTATPCSKSWDSMEGDGPKRFCQDCKLHVYDFAQLTSNEARALLLETEGRLCARIFTRSDGTVLTRDCPVGLARVKRWFVAKATAAAAALLAVVSFGALRLTIRSCDGSIPLISGNSRGSVVAGRMGRPSLPPDEPARDRQVGYGRLAISTQPWARVWVDGQPQGGGPMDFQLTAGRHTLKLESQQHDSLTREIEIKPGETLRLSLRLR
jgi:hypothetical protein